MNDKHKFAHGLLMDWAQWKEKAVIGLGYSSKSHTENIGLPSNPSTRQMGSLKDLPIVLSRADLRRIDSFIREMNPMRRGMVEVRYIGLKTDENDPKARRITEQDHRKNIGIGKTKYWKEWNDIYNSINSLT